MRVRAGRLLGLGVLLCGLAGAPPSYSDSAPVDAPRVDVLAADLGPMARIELSWPGIFDVEAVHDRRVLVLDFIRPFNAPDLGALRQRLGGWIQGIEKSSRQIRLTSVEPVNFQVFKSGRTLAIEMTWASDVAVESPTAGDVSKDGRIVLTPPGQTPERVPAQTPAATRQANGGVEAPPLPKKKVAPAPEAEPAELDEKAKEAIKRLRRSSSLGQATWFVTLPPSILLAARQATAQLQTEAGPDRADVRIDWADRVGVEVFNDRRELLLRIDRPVDSRLIEGLAEGMPEWLEGVSSGYDSILFIGREDTRFDVAHDGGLTAIALTRAAAGEGVAKDREDVRLEILRARLKARQGDTGDAKLRLANLKDENPENADVVAEMASIEASLGSWRRASELYSTAYGLDQTRRDFAAARRALDRENGSQIRLDVDYQQVQDGDLQIPVVLTGRFLPTDTLDAGIRLENRFLDDDQVLRVNGVTEAVNLSRQQGEVHVGGSPDSGQRLEGAVLGSAGGPGAELRYTFRTPDALYGFTATWNRAYWDLVEALVDEGVQDRIALRHERQFSRRWSGELGAALNHFGVDGISTAATSIQVNGAVRYLVPWRAADLSIGYAFDAQYVGTIETRRDANGNAFNPLPLTDTEFHSLTAFLSDTFLDDWRYNLFGSLSLDRFGGFGPSLGAELFWEAGDEIQFGLRAGHSRASGRGDDAVFTRLGGHLLVRF